jgi:hypothetical protein
MLESVFAAYITVQAPQQPDCGPLTEYLAGYQQKYGERPFWAGISDDGKSRTIVLVNPVTGTWTISIARVVNGDQFVCTAASGKDFSPIPTERVLRGTEKQADGT